MNNEKKRFTKNIEFGTFIVILHVNLEILPTIVNSNWQKQVNKLKHIINWTIWSLLALYVMTLVLIHLPATQRFLGQKVSDSMSKLLGANVSIERVELGFFNRIILDDVLILDQTEKDMLRIGRLSAKIDLLPLAQGKVSISSAQLFGAHAKLCKADSLAVPNYQFVLDSLRSKDSTSSSTLNLRINSLIVRHSSVSFDQNDIAETPGQFNTKHWKITDISAYAIIKSLQEDSINANIKRLAFNEKSGFSVSRLSLWLEANSTHALLKEFRLQTPGSDIDIDSINATYDKNHFPETIRYQARITVPTLSLKDFKCFVPGFNFFTQHFTISTELDGTADNINCKYLRIMSDDQSLELHARGEVNHLSRQIQWSVYTSNIDIKSQLTSQCKQAFDQVPDELIRLGNIHIDGSSERNSEGRIDTYANIRTDIGNGTLQFNLNKDERFDGTINTKSFNLGNLINNDDIGTIAAQLNIHGTKDDITVDGFTDLFEYKAYPYQNIMLNGNYKQGNIVGKLRINDPNIQANIDGELHKSNRSTVKLSGTVRDFKPRALNLSDKWGDRKFSADMNVDFIASNLNDAEGSISLNRFEMIGNDSIGDYYQIENLSILSGYEDGIHIVRLSGDMGEAEIQGDFDWETLPQSFVNYIASRLPTLPNLPKVTKATDNNFIVNLHISDADWIQKLLGITISFERPLSLHAAIDDQSNLLDIEGTLPKFTYNGSKFQDMLINISTKKNITNYHVNLTKVMDDSELTSFKLEGEAASNKISASFHWNQSNTLEPENTTNGTINTVTRLYTNRQNIPEAHIHILPSEMTIREKPWSLEPCDILYSEKRLVVDHFSLNHQRQHLHIDGIVSNSPAESIMVDLKELDVAYILDLVDFHSVEFDGIATGTVKASQVFGDFNANADLTVDQFKFQSGNMGTLLARAEWNAAEKQIDIEAVADNGPESQTFIKGYVSPERSDIRLDINADGTNVEFCNSFTNSFLHDVQGKAYGNVTLSGLLEELYLTGDIVVDGQASLTALNTSYILQKDTLKLTPNNIEFCHCVIKDKEGQTGTVNGHIHHDNFSNFTFDIDVDGENLLAYDFPDFDNGIVCGTVYITGSANIHGQPGEVTINCYATPEARSVFAYNATNPDAISNQEFITWGNEDGPSKKKKEEDIHESLASSTNIYINFNINATPDGTIRVLMDSNTNDFISLNGSGNIKASYYNKGPFNMFGTYTVERGTYGITIQNIIKKSFIFQNGGTIVFGGDPFSANLNLQAQYTVNGVSLSDLNLGNSFNNNTVRVNCLMNITGTPGAPHVDFDFELPTVNSEENQMIRSVISSEQEMNQQVLYLLGIGRFYTQGANNAQSQEYGQTQLAMQSFLSGTMSSQINEVLSQVIKSNDWNFGANISTGNEGWHNAEYEGLFSGRMLNNRLLINGQFGYRDNATQATPSFIGDFDIQYLLNRNGNLAVKVYNQTNDRYFTRSSLNTQGIGLIMKKDFNGIRDLFNLTKKAY